MCESVGKANLLTDCFDCKQYMESADLLLTCHPSPRFTTIVFMSSEVRRLLLDLDPFWGTEPLGMFPRFLKRTTDALMLMLLSRTVLKESDDLVILRVIFYSKMTLEKHLHSVFGTASETLGILRKSWHEFYDRLLLLRCFWFFVMPIFVYCSAVWWSAADTNLKLLGHLVSRASFAELCVGVMYAVRDQV